jgi:hypothetical protein
MHAFVIFNSGFCELDKQGYGKQELCPASLFNFDYEREPAGTWEARVVPIFKFSVRQADHELNSRDMGIQSFCSQPYYALPS